MNEESDALTSLTKKLDEMELVVRSRLDQLRPKQNAFVERADRPRAARTASDMWTARLGFLTRIFRVWK
jgi:hypothetical protein